MFLYVQYFTPQGRDQIKKIINKKLLVIYNTSQVICLNFIICMHVYITDILMCTVLYTMKECSSLKSHKYKVLGNIQYYSDQLIMWIHVIITCILICTRFYTIKVWSNIKVMGTRFYIMKNITKICYHNLSMCMYMNITSVFSFVIDLTQ